MVRIEKKNVAARKTRTMRKHRGVLLDCSLLIKLKIKERPRVSKLILV